MKLVIKKH